MDPPVRRLLERIAGPAAAPMPDLAAIGAALAELAADLGYIERWATRLGARTGFLRIHAPDWGPRLTIVHRLTGQVSTVHSHGTWVALSPVSGLETHRRYVLTEGLPGRPTVAEVASLGPAEVATLLPPNDIHDHGHLAGSGAPAYVLILTGDNQLRFEREEWDASSARHRRLSPGELGRWLTTDPWP